MELIKSISLTLHDIDISYICSHPFVFRVDPYFSALVFSRLNRQQDEVEPQVAGLGNLLEIHIRFLHFLFISTLLGHKILFCAAHFFFSSVQYLPTLPKLCSISLNLKEESALRISHLNIFPINSRVLYFGIFWKYRSGRI